METGTICIYDLYTLLANSYHSHNYSFEGYDLRRSLLKIPECDLKIYCMKNLKKLVSEHPLDVDKSLLKDLQNIEFSFNDTRLDSYENLIESM